MTWTVGLRPFARPVANSSGWLTRANGAAQRCEMCGTPLERGHGHIVDTERRSLACTCRACHLLFTAPRAVRGRCRAVPGRILYDPAHPLSTKDWEALRVPAGTAFFFLNSTRGRVVGYCPSPYGAAECALEPGEWQRLADAYPLLREPVPDLEGVLVNRTVTGVESFVLPMYACYALVGEVRLRWLGLDGGAGVQRAIAALLADLRARRTPLR